MASPRTSRKSKEPQPANKAVVGILMLVGFGIIGGSYHLVNTGVLKLGGATQAATLKNFSAKAEFTVRYWILPMVWIVLAIFNVGRGRGKHNALNPLTANEPLVQVQKNILTNSIEQTLFTFGVQLSMLPYLTADQVLKFIPLINVLFFVGRFLFAIGYPNYRSTGFGMTHFPTLFACMWTFYKFQREHMALY
ncbi:hypothetical protein HDE_14117 [Halotydeus destructor]|nr:hypothetical protein HDE_14117 [Halotydeus destructor]